MAEQKPAEKAEVTRSEAGFREYLGTSEQLIASGVEPQMLAVKSYGEVGGWDSFGDKYFTYSRRDGRFKVKRWVRDGSDDPWANQHNWRPRWAAAEAAVAEIVGRITRK